MNTSSATTRWWLDGAGVALAAGHAGGAGPVQQRRDRHHRSAGVRYISDEASIETDEPASADRRPLLIMVGVHIAAVLFHLFVKKKPGARDVQRPQGLCRPISHARPRVHARRQCRSDSSCFQSRLLRGDRRQLARLVLVLIYNQPQPHRSTRNRTKIAIVAGAVAPPPPRWRSRSRKLRQTTPVRACADRLVLRPAGRCWKRRKSRSPLDDAARHRLSGAVVENAGKASSPAPKNRLANNRAKPEIWSKAADFKKAATTCRQKWPNWLAGQRGDEDGSRSSLAPSAAPARPATTTPASNNRQQL